MHSVTRTTPLAVTCLVPCLLLVACPARAGGEAAVAPGAVAPGTVAPPQNAEAAALQAATLDQAQAEANTHAYRDIPQWRAAPAAGTDVGYGALIPSLRAPAYSLQGRLGIALETPSYATLTFGAITGVTIAFNTGSSAPFYGYVIRVPALVGPEVILSRLVSYRNKRFLNFHVGGAVGGDFVIAAQCNSGACNYVLPSTYLALGARVGLSYSAVERSAVGMFVSWQSDFAPCPPSAQGNCMTNLSTVTWSIGWELF